MEDLRPAQLIALCILNKITDNAGLILLCLVGMFSFVVIFLKVARKYRRGSNPTMYVNLKVSK